MSYEAIGKPSVLSKFDEVDGELKYGENKISEYSKSLKLNFTLADISTEKDIYFTTDMSSEEIYEKVTAGYMICADCRFSASGDYNGGYIVPLTEYTISSEKDVFLSFGAFVDKDLMYLRMENIDINGVEYWKCSAYFPFEENSDNNEH